MTHDHLDHLDHLTTAPMSDPRPLSDLEDDATGQLATEWVLVTSVIVIPIILLIPWMLAIITAYWYRIAEVISFPFP